MTRGVFLMFAAFLFFATANAVVVYATDPICLDDDEAGLKFVKEPCKVDTDCYSGSPSTVCKDGRCSCNVGYVEDTKRISFGDTKTICISAPDGGSECKTECARPYICAIPKLSTNASTSTTVKPSTRKKCQCLPPYTDKYGGCILECKADEFYAEGKCIKKCQSNEYAFGGECRKMSKVGGPCKRHDDCSVPYSECNNGKCACGPGFNPNSQNDICETTLRTCPIGKPSRASDGSFLECKVIAEAEIESKKSKRPRIFSLRTSEIYPYRQYHYIDISPTAEQQPHFSKGITDTCPENQFCFVTSGDSYAPGAIGHCCPYQKPSCPIGKPHPNATCASFRPPSDPVRPGRSLVLITGPYGPDACPRDTHTCRRFNNGGLFEASLCCPNPCSNDMLLVNGRCYPRREFGDQCDFEEQCSVGYTGGSCIKGKCSCGKNSAIVESPGSATSCDDSCKAGEKKINYDGDCGPGPKLGEKCDPDFNSACGVNAKCSSTTKTCVCTCGHAKLDDRNCGPEPKCAPVNNSSSSKQQRKDLAGYTFCVIPESQSPPTLTTAVKQCPSGHYCATYMDNLGVCCPKPGKPLCHDGTPAERSCDPKESSTCESDKQCVKYLNEVGPDDPKKYFCCPTVGYVIVD